MAGSTMATARSPFGLRRRVERSTPFHDLRIGAAARSGRAARFAFPGIEFPKPEGARRRTAASALAILTHASVLGLLFALAWLMPAPVKEEPIPIELIEFPKPPPPPPPVAKVEPPPKPAPKAPTPPPPKPVAVVKPAPPAPAPAPKALAERRTANFDPSAQAVKPQVINPSVIAKASPLDTKSLQSSAPREIQTTGINVQAVQAVTNVAAPTPTQVDMGAAAAPALRGPVQGAGATGPSVGPKAIAAPNSNSVGAGSVVRSGDGSSVREGVVSGRDVLGSPDGARVASANTAVGQGNLRGTGEGTTLGGDPSDCDARPEVKAYQEQVRTRTKARWIAPPDAPMGIVTATLRWQLDAGGSVSSVKLISAKDPKVGASVVDALRSAAPFPPMNDRTRCLAGRGLTGTFTLTNTVESSTIAN